MATKSTKKSLEFGMQTQLHNLSASNRDLIESNLKRRLDFRLKPQLIYPWRRQCTVKVLIVTDGNLNFGEGDFGLSTFVRVLKNDAPSRVRFELTLAHILEVNDIDMLIDEPGIARRIKKFRFDDVSHFTPELYDQVWLFGIATTYSGMVGRGMFLDPAEIAAIHAHMQRGGGMFATGDHGYLGRALSGVIPRIRGMRHWGDFPTANEITNEVSMTGPRRNDTNQIGHDLGSQFSDQSDDIPQPLDLRLYSTYAGALRAVRYPHPVLCGRTGRIDVLPDHPHEGECREPSDLTDRFNGSDEYPLNTDGTRIVPEIIAWSRVPAGNDARGTKRATEAHTFGAISTYDGHRAGKIGRIVCDATWHHFVNVNLIGVLEGGPFDEFGAPDEHSSKHDGFLSSPTGLAILDKIKNYYTNIGMWLSPPARQRCFNRFAWWDLVFADRIIEATLTSPEIPLERIPASTLMSIGIHARDAFGRRTSQCQAIEWVLDWLKDFNLIEVAWIDPWDPTTQLLLQEGNDAPLPILDLMPIVDVALGAALVSMRQRFPVPPEKPSAREDGIAMEALHQGANYGISLAKQIAVEQSNVFIVALR